MDIGIEPSLLIGFLTLVVLEIILGIDNIVFITILSSELPEHQQAKARKIGLVLAVLMRIILIMFASWVASLTHPVFSVGEHAVSWRDIILIVGGSFLLLKATWEIHERMDIDDDDDEDEDEPPVFAGVLLQIVAFDMIFSMDSVITAVGLVQNVGVMIAALLVATAVMLLASNAISRFVNKNQSTIMLCLNFLILIGFSLIAEGFHVHIPKDYIYVAMGAMMAHEAILLVWKKKRLVKMQKISRIRRKVKAKLP
jgi:predicted tellurium resistance membrane protein TerC